MSNIRILHVIARMNVGGTSRYIGELVSNIPESNVATGFVQGAEIEDHIVAKVQVFRIPHLGRKISPLNDFMAWMELKKIIKFFDPDVIHTHTFKAGVIGRLSGGRAKKVHTFHGHLFDDKSFSFLERIAITSSERFLATRTDLLISVGVRVGTELRQKGIGNGKEWLSIAPGVLVLPGHDKEESRMKLGLPSDEFLVGWMARMADVKNPHMLLKVAKLMPNTHFVMAGGGELLDEIRENKPENVTVIGWTDASLFWSAVDCAVSTSTNEGMPIALIEAQLAGIPIVATDVGSSAEVISHAETGFLVRNDPLELVKSLELLIRDREMLKKMGERAYSRASELFSVKRMIDAHEEAYKSLG